MYETGIIPGSQEEERACPSQDFVDSANKSSNVFNDPNSFQNDVNIIIEEGKMEFESEKIQRSKRILETSTSGGGSSTSRIGLSKNNLEGSLPSIIKAKRNTKKLKKVSDISSISSNCSPKVNNKTEVNLDIAQDCLFDSKDKGPFPQCK